MFTDKLTFKAYIYEFLTLRGLRTFLLIVLVVLILFDVNDSAGGIMMEREEIVIGIEGVYEANVDGAIVLVGSIFLWTLNQLAIHL